MRYETEFHRSTRNQYEHGGESGSQEGETASGGRGLRAFMRRAT
jgi:hypothetical protein